MKFSNPLAEAGDSIIILKPEYRDASARGDRPQAARVKGGHAGNAALARRGAIEGPAANPRLELAARGQREPGHAVRKERPKPRTEQCAACGHELPPAETAFIWAGSIVCAKCYQRGQSARILSAVV